VLPLNGQKTHPLSAHALGVLRDLLRGAKPTHKINPGVVNRLCREGLVRIEMRDSPYKTRRGEIAFAVITASGKFRLEREEARNGN
jgi:hypothetical protein